MPRYADGEYLDSLAELFKDLERLPASPASAMFRFYISEAQKQSELFLRHQNFFCGAILFETKENLEIKAGQTYGDVEGICTTAGDVGNNLAAGQVKELVDLYDYYQKAENITATSGGAEEEDDASYYERMRESMESFSTAGPINGYIYWNKEGVSPAVADVAVTSPEPCAVDVRVLLQNGQQATSGVLKEIEDALNASDIRPLTDKVTVSAPETVAFDIDVTFYIPQPDAASATVIAAAATQAVEEYVTWQTSKMGRDINPSYLTAKLMEAGVKRVEVRKPVFTVIDDIKVAKLGNKSVLNGGIENV